jgi:hypothetical protein
MRACFAAFFAVLLVLSSGIALARSQSLGDLARKEEERRKTVKDQGKVLTNKDLPRVPQSSPVSPTQPAPAGTKDTAAADDKATADDKTTAAAADAKAPADDAVKDQKYWSERQKALQSQLERDQVLVQAMQSRVNGLTADYARRDDPAQRALIATERQRALDELNRLNESIVLHKQAIADFEEEARRADVPPGWLR